MNAATGCLHAAPCLAAGRYCGMMLWGDAVESLERHSHASALPPGGIGFPLLFFWERALPSGSCGLTMGRAQRTLWAAYTHCQCSSTALFVLCHWEDPDLSPCMAVPAAGKRHWAALHAPALCSQPGTAHLLTSPGLVLASLPSLQLCCSTRGRCTVLHCTNPAAEGPVLPSASSNLLTPRSWGGMEGLPFPGCFPAQGRAHSTIGVTTPRDAAPTAPATSIAPELTHSDVRRET